jgi:hypothetical protein
MRLVRVELGEPGRAGAGRHADREAADGTRQQQPCRALRKQEQQRADRSHAHRRQRSPTAADAVGDGTEEQQRPEIADNVGGIDQRQRDVGEAECLLIEDVERRNQRAAHEHHGDHRGYRPGRGRRFQLGRLRVRGTVGWIHGGG